ncbi:MAG: hypothetical protein P8R54_32360 [Myxococcota bacterium]|nr:hypothetical protein [Myxococcota bacterium]
MLSTLGSHPVGGTDVLSPLRPLLVHKDDVETIDHTRSPCDDTRPEADEACDGHAGTLGIDDVSRAVSPGAEDAHDVDDRSPQAPESC